MYAFCKPRKSGFNLCLLLIRHLVVLAEKAVFWKQEAVNSKTQKRASHLPDSLGLMI